MKGGMGLRRKIMKVEIYDLDRKKINFILNKSFRYYNL